MALDVGVNRTGDTWHVCLEGLKDLDTLAYGWRADAADISQFYPGTREFLITSTTVICHSDCSTHAIIVASLAEGENQRDLCESRAPCVLKLDLADAAAVRCAGQIMLDPYAPLVVDVRLPDNVQVPYASAERSKQFSRTGPTLHTRSCT